MARWEKLSVHQLYVQLYLLFYPKRDDRNFVMHLNGFFRDHNDVNGRRSCNFLYCLSHSTNHFLPFLSCLRIRREAVSYMGSNVFVNATRTLSDNKIASFS